MEPSSSTITLYIFLLTGTAFPVFCFLLVFDFFFSVHSTFSKLCFAHSVGLSQWLGYRQWREIKAKQPFLTPHPHPTPGHLYGAAEGLRAGQQPVHASSPAGIPSGPTGPQPAGPRRRCSDNISSCRPAILCPQSSSTPAQIKKVARRW